MATVFSGSARWIVKLPNPTILLTAKNRFRIGSGANQVLTMISTLVGTARRAVCGRLGEATLPKSDLRPIASLTPIAP
jgi:hypothetical protein